MKRKQADIREKLNEECLKRSKYGSCRMECEAFGAKLGYCGEVWKKAKE